jgi:hypothetical protein
MKWMESGARTKDGCAVGERTSWKARLVHARSIVEAFTRRAAAFAWWVSLLTIERCCPTLMLHQLPTTFVGKSR